MAQMEKEDAELFTQFTRFIGVVFGERCPLISRSVEDFLKKEGLNFDEVKHLESLGLLTSDTNIVSNGFGVSPRLEEDGAESVNYFNRTAIVHYDPSNLEDFSLRIGRYLLAEAGVQLSRICEVSPIEGLWDSFLRDCRDQQYNFKAKVLFKEQA